MFPVFSFPCSRTARRWLTGTADVLGDGSPGGLIVV